MEHGIQERLEDFIRRKGLRRTGQRDLIIKSAFSKDEHFTAEELFDRVRKSSNDISRAMRLQRLLLQRAGGQLAAVRQERRAQALRGEHVHRRRADELGHEARRRPRVDVLRLISSVEP